MQWLMLGIERTYDLSRRVYFVTYDLPVVIVRPSNNYGHYGGGGNIWDWICVEDYCPGIYIEIENVIALRRAFDNGTEIC